MRRWICFVILLTCISPRKAVAAKKPAAEPTKQAKGMNKDVGPSYERFIPDYGGLSGGGSQEFSDITVRDAKERFAAVLAKAVAGQEVRHVRTD